MAICSSNTRFAADLTVLMMGAAPAQFKSIEFSDVTLKRGVINVTSAGSSVTRETSRVMNVEGTYYEEIGGWWLRPAHAETLKAAAETSSSF